MLQNLKLYLDIKKIKPSKVSFKKAKLTYGQYYKKIKHIVQLFYCSNGHNLPLDKN